MTPPTPKQWVTPATAALAAGRDVSTVRRWAAAGLVDAIGQGKGVEYELGSVLAAKRAMAARHGKGRLGKRRATSATSERQA